MASSNLKGQKLLAGAQERARIHNRVCTINKYWVKAQLHRGTCALTGLIFDYKKAAPGQRANYLAPSIDRIDVAQGYTPENCRMVVAGINIAMNEFGEDRFREIAEAYINHRRG